MEPRLPSSSSQMASLSSLWPVLHDPRASLFSQFCEEKSRFPAKTPSAFFSSSVRRRCLLVAAFLETISASSIVVLPLCRALLFSLSASFLNWYLQTPSWEAFFGKWMLEGGGYCVAFLGTCVALTQLGFAPFLLSVKHGLSRAFFACVCPCVSARNPFGGQFRRPKPTVQSFWRPRRSPKWIPRRRRPAFFWYGLFLLTLAFPPRGTATVVVRESTRTQMLPPAEKAAERWLREGDKCSGRTATTVPHELTEEINKRVFFCPLSGERAARAETGLKCRSAFSFPFRFSRASASLLRTTHARLKTRTWRRQRKAHQSSPTSLDHVEASWLPTLFSRSFCLPSFSSSSSLSSSSLASSLSLESLLMPAAASQKCREAVLQRKQDPVLPVSSRPFSSLPPSVPSSRPSRPSDTRLSIFSFFADLSSSLCSLSLRPAFSLLSPSWDLRGLPVLLYGSAAPLLETPRKERRREKEEGRGWRDRRGQVGKESAEGAGTESPEPWPIGEQTSPVPFGGLGLRSAAPFTLEASLDGFSPLSSPSSERKKCHSSCLSCSRPGAQNACRSCPNQIASPSEVFTFSSSASASSLSSPALWSTPGASVSSGLPYISGSSEFLSPSSSALSSSQLHSLPYILAPLYPDGSGFCVPVAPGDVSPSAADICLNLNSEQSDAVSSCTHSSPSLPHPEKPSSAFSSSCSLSSPSALSSSASASTMPCSFAAENRLVGGRVDTEQRRGEGEKDREKVKDRVVGHCHPSCLTCRADCCYRKADNCLSCDLKFSSLRRLYSDGTGRCLSIRKRDEAPPIVGSSSSGRREEASELSDEYGAVGDWFQALAGFVDLQTAWEFITGQTSVSNATASSPPSSSPAFTSTSSSTPPPSSSSSVFSSGSPSTSASSTSSTSASPSSASFRPLLSSFAESPFALPPPSASSVCRALPSSASALPLLHFLHLFFLHADNNLEESALMDMEEILSPYVGRRALNAILAAQNSGVSGGGTPGGAASQTPPPLAPHLALGQMYIVALLDRPKSGSPSKATEASIGRVHICGNLEYTQKGKIRVRGNKTISVQEGWQGTVELSSETAYELLRVKNEDGGFEWMLLRDLGEVDMNSPSVLAAFIERNLNLFPTRHAALTLWNHGSAWVGFGDDESNADHSPMSLKEIVQGLQKGLRGSVRGKNDPAFKFSVLGFDACLMASYDVLEAVAPFAHFVIASEDNEPGHGWNYHLTDPTTLFLDDGAHAGGSRSRQPPSRRAFFSSDFSTPASLSASVASLASPAPFRLSTAYEYASRFVASYALHPRTSVALTLSLIEVKTFLTFKHKFEEVMDHLFACGGSSISAVVRRALAASFTIRGCEMVSLCSCFDLLDFLDHLLRLLSAQRQQIYSSSPSLSAPTSSASPPRKRAAPAPLLSVSEKVASLRRMLKAMVVMEVGGREDGRYAGLSMYFPDPNMQLHCKNTRGAALWAEQYHRSVQSRYASFVKSIQNNQRGGACYFSSPVGSAPPPQATEASPQPAEEAEEEPFEVLEARLLGGRRQRGNPLVGLAAIAPSSLMFALTFRGFVSSVHGKEASASDASHPQRKRNEQSTELQSHEVHLAFLPPSSSLVPASSSRPASLRPPPASPRGVNSATEWARAREKGDLHIVVEVFSTLQASMTDINDIDWGGSLGEERDEDEPQEERQDDRNPEKRKHRTSEDEEMLGTGKQVRPAENSRSPSVRYGETGATRKDGKVEEKKPRGEEKEERNERKDTKRRAPEASEPASISSSVSPEKEGDRKEAHADGNKAKAQRRKAENFSVVESWWDERVWLLRQKRAVLPSFKDPRRLPLALDRQTESEEDDADEESDGEDWIQDEGKDDYLESLLVAMQDVPESPSRRNTEERRIFTFPFIFYEDAAGLECARGSVASSAFAHGNSTSLSAPSLAPSRSESPGSPLPSASSSHEPRTSDRTNVLMARRLADAEEWREANKETEQRSRKEGGFSEVLVNTSGERLSSTGRPGESGEDRGGWEVVKKRAKGPFFSRPFVVSSETLVSFPDAAAGSAGRRHLQSKRREALGSSSSASSSSSYVFPGASSGVTGQREDGRACGERAYLLGEMEGDRVANLSLYVVVNNMPTERPQTSGGILLPIRKRFTFERFQPPDRSASTSLTSEKSQAPRWREATDEEAERRETLLQEQLAAALREEREGQAFAASGDREKHREQSEAGRRTEGKERKDGGTEDEETSSGASPREAERTDWWLGNAQSGKKEGGREQEQGQEGGEDPGPRSSEREEKREERGDEGEMQAPQWTRITMEELAGDVLFLWGEKEDVGELEIVSVSRGTYARLQKEKKTHGKEGDSTPARKQKEGETERRDMSEGNGGGLAEIDTRHILGFVMQSITEKRGGFLLSLPAPPEETTSSPFSFFSSFFSFDSGEQKTKGDVCELTWIGDGICDPPCDRPEFAADGGDCPHRSRLGRLWLDQQQPTGPCINNQCGLNAICEENPTSSDFSLSADNLPPRTRLVYFEKGIQRQPASSSSSSTPSASSPASSNSFVPASAFVSAPSFASSTLSDFLYSPEADDSQASMGKVGSDRKPTTQENAIENQASQSAPATSTVWFTPKGSYRCRCKVGYEGDGLNCRDIDECAAEETSPCHPAALCINTKGSFRCVCKAHYVGDGVTFCVPQSDLVPGDTSNSVAQCVDKEGRPSCLATLHCLPDGSCGCSEGYVRTTADTCEDIDECEEGLASCAPASLALCINTEGGYFCSCREGYEGDGRQCVKGPSVLHARFVVSVDFRPTMEREGGIEGFARLFRDSVAEAVPTLSRERIEVLRVSEGSISILLRIHPPSSSPFSSRKKRPFASRDAAEGGVHQTGDKENALAAEGRDARFVKEDETPLTSAEILLALQYQLEDPTSPLRTGPFGEYAAVSSLEEYHFLTKSQAYGTHDVLDLLTSWLPAWITDHVPRSIIVGVEICFFVVAFLILLNCLIKICRRRKKRNKIRSQSARTVRRRPAFCCCCMGASSSEDEREIPLPPRRAPVSSFQQHRSTPHQTPLYSLPPSSSSSVLSSSSRPLGETRTDRERKERIGRIFPGDSEEGMRDKETLEKMKSVEAYHRQIIAEEQRRRYASRVALG
ncbi:calcium binding egf domain-containing protein [Toxoplasma gondii p89]|uniref:Calcium binding egf domain-containing protein n=1 Tax=Toxoplasma gondii p89 TaxID=943119 RepID=A0A086L6Q5_TOXGO|nr:calcium binding egf domain-containing protein [Toxoplasma gondii p89]